MADLKLMDKIEVPTSHGLCEIHLNFGSVTKLAIEDKVDVLVVSAFPGDYSPTPTSVIGALSRDLGISVRSLSKNKEEDLRGLFSCWWSKPLSGSYSFNRILCFEGGFKRGSRPPMVVGEVFRSLVSLCKEQDIKVMMPLLAAGDQGYSQNMMLRLITEAAIHWMQIGLPLKILKIVIFARDLSKIHKHPLLDYFKNLKAKWIEKMEKEKEEPEVHPINYDVYLSYNTEDKNLANTVKKFLTDKSQQIRIYSNHQNINPDESWQEEIYQVMVTCARVITILSPRFLSDEACLEQYNIALCCTRNMKRDYLAPFYVDSIDAMPTYMCLIQYVDCRPADFDKILQACYVVTNWLQVHLAEIQRLEAGSKKALTQPKSSAKPGYDVFISYSHKNTDAAKHIHKHLTLFHPDWNIFIDISELQTGVAWQVKLYDSIESSGIVIALLSPTYVASKVCQEEYNLALAMHHDVAYQTVLYPILVETVDHLPAWCSGIPPSDCRDVSDKELDNIISKIQLLKRLDLLERPNISAIDDATSYWRTENYISDFACLPNICTKDIETITSSNDFQFPRNSTNIDVVLCYHKSNESAGKFLHERLKFYLPNMQISLPQESKVRHALFDEADLIVPLFSSEFTRSAELSEELNTALCRQRVVNKLVLFPIFLEDLPSSPAYFHLLWSLFSCADKIWDDNEHKKDGLSYSPAERCLDIAARVISFIIIYPEKMQGSFKTLLSTEELQQTTLLLRSKKIIYSDAYNPLFFNTTKPGHSVTKSEPDVKTNANEDVVETIKAVETENIVQTESLEPTQETFSRGPTKTVRFAEADKIALENDDEQKKTEEEIKKPCENTDNATAPSDSENNTEPLKPTQETPTKELKTSAIPEKPVGKSGDFGRTAVDINAEDKDNQTKAEAAEEKRKGERESKDDIGTDDSNHKAKEAQVFNDDL